MTRTEPRPARKPFVLGDLDLTGGLAELATGGGRTVGYGDRGSYRDALGGDRSLATYVSVSCFAEGTRILVPGGEEIPIEALEPNAPGCSVLRPDGTAARVVQGRRGPEEPRLYAFTLANGAQLAVTLFHPMVCQHDSGTPTLRAAKDLRVGDRLPVVGENGTTALSVVERIDRVELPRERHVLNLVLDGDDDWRSHLVVANGIVTGDLLLQAGIQAQVDRRAPLAAVADTLA